MEGEKTIEAYVCEYISPLELSGEADIDEVLCKAEYEEFLRRTQLQPEPEIVFTVPGKYMEIECQIRSDRNRLRQSVLFHSHQGWQAIYGQIQLRKIARRNGVFLDLHQRDLERQLAVS